jgi:hypothetical protein
MKHFNENWDGVLRQQQLTENTTVYTSTDSQSPLAGIYLNEKGEILIHFRGAGMLSYEYGRKEIPKRLHDIADKIASGKLSYDQASRIVSDTKGGIGDFTGYFLRGFADAEKALALPAVKRKLTLLKKSLP